MLPETGNQDRWANVGAGGWPIDDLPTELSVQLDLAGRSADKAVTFLERVFDKIKLNPRPQVVDTIDLANVVRYFQNEHPGDPAIVRGALLRCGHPKGNLLFQVFLDANNDVCMDESGAPYGRRLVVRSLAPNLAARFAGGIDTVIFS